MVKLIAQAAPINWQHPRATVWTILISRQASKTKYPDNSNGYISIEIIFGWAIPTDTQHPKTVVNTIIY